MAEKLGADTWVWVMVMDPETDPQYLGAQDDKTDVAYIPTFLNKKEAQKGMENMPLPAGKKIEIQAVMYDQLCRDAAANGFHIFILNAEGEIQDKVSPTDKTSPHIS